MVLRLLILLALLMPLSLGLVELQGWLLEEVRQELILEGFA